MPRALHRERVDEAAITQQVAELISERYAARIRQRGIGVRKAIFMTHSKWLLQFPHEELRLGYILLERPQTDLWAKCSRDGLSFRHGVQRVDRFNRQLERQRLGFWSWWSAELSSIGAACQAVALASG